MLVVTSLGEQHIYCMGSNNVMYTSTRVSEVVKIVFVFVFIFFFLLFILSSFPCFYESISSFLWDLDDFLLLHIADLFNYLVLYTLHFCGFCFLIFFTSYCALDSAGIRHHNMCTLSSLS